MVRRHKVREHVRGYRGPGGRADIGYTGHVKEHYRGSDDPRESLRERLTRPAREVHGSQAGADQFEHAIDDMFTDMDDYAGPIGIVERTDVSRQEWEDYNSWWSAPPSQATRYKTKNGTALYTYTGHRYFKFNEYPDEIYFED